LGNAERKGYGMDETDYKIKKTIESLKANGFDVWFVNDQLEAAQMFWKEIFNKIKPQTASWGDSQTMHSLGIIPELKQSQDVELIETFGAHLTRVEQISNR
jgi:L-lactate utilization protein LutB